MNPTWKPYPEAGLPEIDVEHRAIAAVLRDLLAAVVDDDRERTVSLGRKLVDASIAHFAHEDELMREVRFPGAAQHTQIHREFLEESKRQVDGAESRGLSADLLRWAGGLDEWFYRHVMTEDLRLAIAVRRARAEAALGLERP